MTERSIGAVPVIDRHDQVDAAARLMTETDVGRLAVVDDSGRLIGMVSHRDLVRGLLPGPDLRPGT